jgi:hypothetical protein
MIKDQKIEIYTDDVADKLDELADISVCWKKYREAGRMPPSIRMVMIETSKEIVALVNLKQPPAYK